VPEDGLKLTRRTPYPPFWGQHLDQFSGRVRPSHWRENRALDTKHKLPENIERYLAALSKLYAQDGKRALREIIVNAQTRVVEEWTYDNWNGGTYGHALYLVLPDTLFLAVAKKREEIQSEIARDLNQLHNIQNEHIAEVFLEMDVIEDGDWRRDSGLLKSTTRMVAPDRATRI
jgi:hypothetical protein